LKAASPREPAPALEIETQQALLLGIIVIFNSYVQLISTAVIWTPTGTSIIFELDIAMYTASFASPYQNLGI